MTCDIFNLENKSAINKIFKGAFDTGKNSINYRLSRPKNVLKI